MTDGMKVLLVSGNPKVASQPILEVVHELSPHGVEVHLARWGPPTQALRDAVETVTVWGPVAVVPEAPARSTFTGPIDPADFTATTDQEVDDTVVSSAGAAALRVRTLRTKVGKSIVGKVLRRLRRMGDVDRVWRRLRRDDRLLRLAGEVQVIVALDAQAVLATWKVAQRSPEPAVVYGLSAGRGVITRALAG